MLLTMTARWLSVDNLWITLHVAVDNFCGADATNLLLARHSLVDAVAGWGRVGVGGELMHI